MERIKSWLQKREATGERRRLYPVIRMPDGRLQSSGSQSGSSGFSDFSSNDYLALSQHPAMRAAAALYLEKYGTGAGAARLMSGDLDLFHELEHAIANLKNNESALLFGNGYIANVSVIAALVGRGDVILCDRLNHASIYDGCRLSGARLVRFRHNDPGHLEELLSKHHKTGRVLIVVESIYSMDGDRCPLPAIVELKNRYGAWLMVDEAHATGVFGQTGGGVIQEEGVAESVDIAMGTFGKALGSYGAYIAASRAMVDYLVNRARGFIYSTGLPPAVAGASLAALRIVAAEPGRRDTLHKYSRLFKNRLQSNGLTGHPGSSQIVPVLVGDSANAVQAAEKLRRQGIFATAVRPPTVPSNTARLRFSITLHHTEEILIQAADRVAAVLRDVAPGASFPEAVDRHYF